MNYKDVKISETKRRLNEGTFLKYRNYREDQSDINKFYWEFIFMVLLSSKNLSEDKIYLAPHEFGKIVTLSYKHIFLNIEKTQAALIEIPRGVKLDRDYWKEKREELLKIRDDQLKMKDETTLKLYQSMISSKNISNLINRSKPYSVSVFSFDKWHKKLKQPVSSVLLKYYPEELIDRSNNDIRITLNVMINNTFSKQYHDLAKYIIKVSYIGFMLEEIDHFYDNNPDISNFDYSFFGQQSHL